jgi:hypothetical protein
LKENGWDLRELEERWGVLKHLLLQQLGDARSNKGAIGSIGKKDTNAQPSQTRKVT